VTDLNPQAKQMADESMVRGLDAQARAIWPQEQQLIRRYEIPAEARILDAGCGTGEGSSRLAELFSQSQVIGVDIVDHHLELASSRYANLATRLKFEHRSIFELGFPDDSFDLTVCRHVMHSIPHPDRVLAELARVTRPGGYLHLIAEDYGMLHFQRGKLDPSDFWHVVAPSFAAATGTDLFIGRNTFGILATMKLYGSGTERAHTVGRDWAHLLQGLFHSFRALCSNQMFCTCRARGESSSRLPVLNRRNLGFSTERRTASTQEERARVCRARDRSERHEVG
jgi:SAM-dependent methyltransferase